MNRHAFVNEVQRLTGLTQTQDAAEGTRIVLSILSHRLTPQEAGHVAAQLPHDVAEFWASDTWMVNFLSLSRQFQLKYRHTAELFSLITNELQKAQIPIGAEHLSKAVFHVLKQQIAQGESEDIAAQLPDEIKQFWRAA